MTLGCNDPSEPAVEIFGAAIAVFYELIDEDQVAEYDEDSDEFVQNWNMVKAYFHKPLEIVKLIKTSKQLVKLDKISEDAIAVAEEIIASQDEVEGPSDVPIDQALFAVYSWLVALIEYYNVTKGREPG